MLLLVPIRHIYLSSKEVVQKMSGIGVTTSTILRTKKKSLYHLGDFIIPFGLSKMIEAEEERVRVTSEDELVSQL